MTEDDILRIAINLEGEIYKQFEEVQQFLGVKNRTDVLRWLIKNFYDTLVVKNIIEKK